MSLTLIIGPMKSSKSLELVALTEPHRQTVDRVCYIKPKRDVRSETITSRLGLEVEALNLDELSEAPLSDVYAVDELHMFHPDKTHQTVYKWLKDGATVIASGLNTDHAGRLMPTIARVLELSPETLINKQAVCEKCGFPATHTQVMNSNGSVISKSMPPEVPDDGTYRYEARCRLCFK